MALATIQTNITRPVTPRGNWTDTIKARNRVTNWWSTVAGMAYPDPTSGNTRIRPRIGSRELLGNGVIPFKAGGFRPAVFDDPNPTPYLSQVIPSGGASTVSFVMSGQSETGFTEIAGLAVDGSMPSLGSGTSATALGFRLNHNNAFGIILGSSVLNRFTEFHVAVGEVVTMAVFVDFANKIVAASKNGGAFVTVTGMNLLPAASSQNWMLNVGAEMSNNRFDGDIHDFMVMPGFDIRTDAALLADIMAYRTAVWG